MRKVCKILLAFIIVLLLVFNGYLYNESIRQEKVISQYHLSTIQLAKSHISNASKLINNEIYIPGLVLEQKYERLFLTAKEFRAVGDYLSLFNIYYTYIEPSNKVYGGRISTSQLFDYYYHILTGWALSIKNNDAKNIPSEEKIQCLRKDIDNLIRIFQVYSGVDYSEEEKIEDLNYKGLENRLKKFSENSNLEEIREESKNIFR